MKPETILTAVSEFYKTSEDIITGPSQKDIHCKPRNVYYYLCSFHRYQIRENFTECAKVVNRTHGTLIKCAAKITGEVLARHKVHKEIMIIELNLGILEKKDIFWHGHAPNLFY